MICGGGVRYSGAEEELIEFCERFNIPFAETQAGKGIISSATKFNLGGIGTTGNLAANLVAKEADLIIGLGTRYTDFTTASKWLFQNPEVEFLNINIGKNDSIKMEGLGVVGDIKVTLKDIIEELNGYKSKYEKEFEKASELWKKELARLYTTDYFAEGYVEEVAGHLPHVLKEFGEQTNSYLTQTRVLGILREELDKDAIVVGSSGSLPGDLQRAWTIEVEKTYHVEYGFSCMGYEVNAALGVKLAVGDSQEVYSFVGDGSYMMSHSELPTSIQEKKKINIILFDNMAFGCINNLEMSNGLDSFGTEFRYRDYKSDTLTGGLVPVDFATNAKGYGCVTYRVTNEEELREAIRDSKKQMVSTLLDIKVLPKTMTNGYESFWRVGNAEISTKEEIVKATKDMKEKLKVARKF